MPPVTTERLVAVSKELQTLLDTYGHDPDSMFELAGDRLESLMVDLVFALADAAIKSGAPKSKVIKLLQKCYPGEMSRANAMSCYQCLIAHGPSTSAAVQRARAIVKSTQN